MAGAGQEREKQQAWTETGEVHPGYKVKIFPLEDRTVKQWHRLLRQVVRSPSSEVSSSNWRKFWAAWPQSWPRWWRPSEVPSSLGLSASPTVSLTGIAQISWVIPKYPMKQTGCPSPSYFNNLSTTNFSLKSSIICSVSSETSLAWGWNKITPSTSFLPTAPIHKSILLNLTTF